MIHNSAICEGSVIGQGTRIWAFVHILPGATIGNNCNICDGVFIEGDVHVGNGVTIKSGVQLWDGVRIHDDVFIGPNATFTNDKYPRSRRRTGSYPLTIIGRGASVGANATILPGISVGEFAVVGAGAVVTRNVRAGEVVVGNPARFHAWVSEVYYDNEL